MHLFVTLFLIIPSNNLPQGNNYKAILSFKNTIGDVISGDIYINSKKYTIDEYGEVVIEFQAGNYQLQIYKEGYVDKVELIEIIGHTIKEITLFSDNDVV